jgi:hypothetical protein
MSGLGDTPLLSVVATARNDNHGGDLLYRMQVFVRGLAEQAARHRLPLELVLVEWNPPEAEPKLSDALEWPPEGPFFSARVIEVPPQLHLRLEHADRLPLFQMIAKNVGIRRARGEFVLATNVDLLFPDDLMHFLAQTRLRHGRFYRVDRYDVASGVALERPLDEHLAAARASVLRICRREGTLDLATGRFYRIYDDPTRLPLFLARCVKILRGISRRAARAPFLVWAAANVVARELRLYSRSLARRSSHFAWLLAAAAANPRRVPARISRWLRAERPPHRGPGVRRRHPLRGARLQLAYAWSLVRAAPKRIREAWEWEAARVRLHTNACGDFTLMARADWERLRGYVELQVFSMHLDSLLLYEAHYHGLDEVFLPYPVYHLEHGAGFKPDPESLRSLNTRLDREHIPQISNAQFLEWALEMYRTHRPLRLNDDDWGFAREELRELRPALTVPEHEALV